MTEERSPLVRAQNGYGSTQDASHLSGAGDNHSDIQVDNTTSATPEEQIDSTSTTVSDDQMRSTLSFLTRIGFGFGHVYNDLCAGVWFSYTLLFMQGALMVPGAEAGALMMLGQVGDAIATPIVGFLADRYGTKRKWHCFGTFLVFITFPMIFSMCPMCKTAPYWWHLVYFGSVILIFQLGWAIVQITHLAMIPEMSRTRKDRSDLTALRYSASVISNVIVFIVTWAVLHTNRSKAESTIGPDDAYRFRDISLILTLIGITLTVLFHFSLSASGYGDRRRQALAYNGRYDNAKGSGDEEDKQPLQPARPRKNFFKSALLYQNAFLYVFSRLFMTTALVYIPLWLDERSWSARHISPSKEPREMFKDKNVEHIAIIPMISFLSSFLSSMAMKYTNRFCGHQIAYLLGSMICISGCTVVSLAIPADASAWRLYGVAMLFGTGSSVTMISSLCITADMIGRHADQSGFIYSAVTFADKLITGIVVVVIESLKCKNRVDCPEYYRDVLAYGCGAAAVLGVFTLFTLKCNRRRRRTLVV